MNKFFSNSQTPGINSCKICNMSNTTSNIRNEPQSDQDTKYLINKQEIPEFKTQPNSNINQQAKRAKNEPMIDQKLNIKKRFICPYCFQSNLDLKALRDHCNQYHLFLTTSVVCPVCTSYDWGN